MSHLDKVDELFGDIPYMTRPRANLVKDLITQHQLRDIIEIGFFHGKSSAYIAAILEDQGAGHLTTFDLVRAREKTPNIEDLLKGLDLSHRVTPFFAKRSYTWELQRLINSENRPQFDFCFFDGGHTWDNTGFGVLLIDMLLRPGGFILLDDMDWTIDGSKYYQQNPKKMKPYDADERAVPAVRRVWDSILPHLGYEHVAEYPQFELGLARKTN
ncbi:MAG: class I SAM-dependent methyltransferase [Pseudomonadota bacterium]|nr:class I SAM-dependent methyltransferase [Pseudomonadota bacterium]